MMAVDCGYFYITRVRLGNGSNECETQRFESRSKRIMRSSRDPACGESDLLGLASQRTAVPHATMCTAGESGLMCRSTTTTKSLDLLSNNREHCVFHEDLLTWIKIRMQVYASSASMSMLMPSSAFWAPSEAI